jgi:hypothetical protein
MTNAPAERLNAEHYESSAEECRALAREAKNPSHRTMLQHMAEAWERRRAHFGRAVRSQGMCWGTRKAKKTSREGPQGLLTLAPARP